MYFIYLFIFFFFSAAVKPELPKPEEKVVPKVEESVPEAVPTPASASAAVPHAQVAIEPPPPQNNLEVVD